MILAMDLSTKYSKLVNVTFNLIDGVFDWPGFFFTSIEIIGRKERREEKGENRIIPTDGSTVAKITKNRLELNNNCQCWINFV